MKLWAISDLHLDFEENARALQALGSHPEDWLVVAGDVSSRDDSFQWGISHLARLFRKVIWVPGNHDLWTVPGGASPDRGEARYANLVAFCRSQGVLTPEDPYPLWEGEGGPSVLAPLFLLYDYSFRPDDVAKEEAVAWATKSGVLCADERFLHPDPHPSRADWCLARCLVTEERLSAIDPGLPAVIVNHFPLREDLVRLPRIPRFSIWCGTRRTEEWHRRFRAKVVVSGHLHIRATDWRDGVRFEEVSLGYPPQWRAELGVEFYLREILPGRAVER